MPEATACSGVVLGEMTDNVQGLGHLRQFPIVANDIEQALDILFDEISLSNYLQIAFIFGLQTL